MPTATVPDVHAFADWIGEIDEHAAHHLRLLDEAERALETPAAGATAGRIALAAKLERWRYQHLHEHAGRLTARNEALVDALDSLANRLAARPARPPRAVRHAVRDAGYETGTIADALEALDRGMPLDELARWAGALTRGHFCVPAAEGGVRAGRRRMLLYAPLYVASDCVNYCTYCGFRYPRDIPRKQLSVAEAVEEARVLHGRGFRHVLVVGGDFPSRTTTAYYREILESLGELNLQLSIEIAAQSTDAYAALVQAGACTLTLYQETYDEQLYANYHVRGPKASYHWRLEAHDRAAEAGMPQLGLGILLGLADPRADLRAMLRHAAYLAERFPGRTLAFSLPRIREAPPEFRIPFAVSDEELIRLYCILRIAFPRAELVMSTRERAPLRNRLAGICITQMSAGSSTTPGGYLATDEKLGEQFPVADHRSPAEVARWLDDQGFHVAWT
jgi:2-iminoacetate synthase